MESDAIATILRRIAGQTVLLKKLDNQRLGLGRERESLIIALVEDAGMSRLDIATGTGISQSRVTQIYQTGIARRQYRGERKME